MKIEATGLKEIDGSLLDLLERDAAAKGFQPLWRNKSADEQRRYSCYETHETKSSQSTSLSVVWSEPAVQAKTLEVDLFRKAKDPETRRQLDALGDFFRTELQKSVGDASVKMESLEFRLYVF